MSQIMDALRHLNNSIDYLDLAMTERTEELTKAGQQDLFGSKMDPATVAQKLDSAIEKVERVLKSA